jgi:hypothetical protein
MQMMMRILVALASLVILSAAATGQEQQIPAPQKTTLNAIGSYTKSIDQFTKRNAKKRRIFGIIPGEEDKPDKWAEFKTIAQEVQANLFDSAHVWRRDGKVVAAKFSLTSSSGDWYHYVDYYFRADGTLAKIHAQLNTFSGPDGGISIVREKFYSASGCCTPLLAISTLNLSNRENAESSWTNQSRFTRLFVSCLSRSWCEVSCVPSHWQ